MGVEAMDLENVTEGSRDLWRCPKMPAPGVSGRPIRIAANSPILISVPYSQLQISLSAPENGESLITASSASPVEKDGVDSSYALSSADVEAHW
jgi:hypothetical protein